MISSQIQLASYLFASILFILSLGGLSSQESAKRGVLYGIVGMIIAVVSTVIGEGVEGHIYIVIAILIAAGIGLGSSTQSRDDCDAPTGCHPT